jgi:PAS domain S-box-containing protein
MMWSARPMPTPMISLARFGWRWMPVSPSRVFIRGGAAAAIITVLLAGSLQLPYLDHATIALLIVTAVVGLAVYSGPVEAFIAALVGGAGYDYFYLPPRGFGIEKPEHLIALAMFFLVAAAVGHMASRLKHLLDQRDSLMQLSLEPLCIADLKGKLESVNDAFAALLGWPGKELLSRPLVEFVHAADRPRIEAAIRDVIETGSIAELESRCPTRDGRWRWLRWRIGPSPTGGAWLSAAARDITEEKWANEKLRALADQVMNAQEEERRRIARELHDDVTQRLAALGIELGLLRQEAGNMESAAIDQDVARLQSAVIGLSDDVRGLSHSLHPSILEHSSLSTALEMHCHEFSQQSGIAATFTARDVPAEIPKPIGLAFYRIAQEALRNVALHSGATAVNIVLSGGDLAMHVIDNGKGFEMSKAKVSPGLGLVSMEERGRLAGAEVTVASVPGEGTTVSVALQPQEQALA